MGEVSRFGTGKMEDLPDDLREDIDEIANQTGFVPNVFLALAHRPAELRAFMDLHKTLMEKDTGLSKAEREMIVVATSAANSCVYCVVSHGAILRIRSRQPLLSDHLAINYRRADLYPRQRSMIDFAVKDSGAITALFAYSNRMADLAALTPNTEFYSMGR